MKENNKHAFLQEGGRYLNRCNTAFSVNSNEGGQHYINVVTLVNLHERRFNARGDVSE